MIFRLFILVLLVYSNTLLAGLMLNKNSEIVFASVAQGQEILGRVDDFVQQLSPFDRGARMKTNQTVSTKQYLQFVRQHVQSWTHQDRQKLTIAFATVSKALAIYPLNFPAKILMVKTSGAEEADAAYTRTNAIMLGNTQMAFSQEALQFLLFHELFHLLTRSNATLKQQLYQTIGFYRADNLRFPATLSHRKMTNPDAPFNDHFIRLKHQQKTIYAVPVLLANSDQYDLKKGGDFFSYLQFKLLVVNHQTKTRALDAILTAGQPELLAVADVPDFFTQVGRNTDYIIHPEEILAENFALLLMGAKNLKNPELTKKIKHLLEQ